METLPDRIFFWSNHINAGKFRSLPQHTPLIKMMNIGYHEVNKTEHTSDYRAYLQLREKL